MTEKKTEAIIPRVEAPLALPDAKNTRLLATDLLNSKMFRGIETVPMAIAVIQCGVEIGIPPIQALQNIKPIKGQLTLSARLLMALAAAKGRVTWEVVESTDQKCEIIFTRPGWKPLKETFTIEEAKKAGLVKADSGWANYPKDMLFARCGSRGIRRIAMDLTLGMYSTEEMQDVITVEAKVVEDEPRKEATPGRDPILDGDQPDQESGEGTSTDGTATQPDHEPEPMGGNKGVKSPGESVADTGPPPGKPYGETGPAGEDGPDPLGEAVHAGDQEDEDKEKESLIHLIKERLAEEKIDERGFKEWLFHLQNTYRPVKFYCGKQGPALRFHMGRIEDLKYLVGKLDASIAVFQGRKEKKA